MLARCAPRALSRAPAGGVSSACERRVLSTLPQTAPGEHLVPSSVSIPAPPAPARAVPNTFEMKALFLGYDVGRFELEMYRGAPQLVADSGGLSSFSKHRHEPIHPHAEHANAASSRFDLSAHSAAPQAQQRPGGDLKSSWASSRASQASLGRREGEAEPRFSNNLQFGHPTAAPTAAAAVANSDEQAVPFSLEAALAGLPPPSPTPSRSTPSSSVSASASANDPHVVSHLPSPTSMPANNRIIVHSSVVLYQNVFFCWSPRTFADVTVDSLAFLRVLTPKPELILLGSGREISARLPEEVLAFLRSLGIGVEVMDSGNAIASYNILTDEGRTVLAAMIQKPEPEVKQVKESPSKAMRRKLGYWVD